MGAEVRLRGRTPILPYRYPELSLKPKPNCKPVDKSDTGIAFTLTVTLKIMKLDDRADKSTNLKNMIERESALGDGR